MLAAERQISQVRDFLIAKQNVYVGVESPGVELLRHAAKYVLQRREEWRKVSFHGRQWPLVNVFCTQTRDTA